MNNNNDSLIKQVINCLRDRKEIPNPYIYQLTEFFIQIIRNKETLELTQLMADLIDETDAFWRRVDKSGLSSEFVFNVGRVFTITTMIKKYYESESSYYSPIELANKYSNRHQLFKRILDTPGITHNELASQIKISVSALSQLMVALHSDGIVSSRKIGRNKYYYLSDFGKTVLRTIETQQSLSKASVTITAVTRNKIPDSQIPNSKHIEYSNTPFHLLKNNQFTFRIPKCEGNDLIADKTILDNTELSNALA